MGRQFADYSTAGKTAQARAALEEFKRFNSALETLEAGRSTLIFRNAAEDRAFETSDTVMGDGTQITKIHPH